MNKKGKGTAKKPDNPGAVFREARLKTGKTREMVASELHINVSSLSDLEKGCFTTAKGKIKYNLPWLVHDLAEEYNRPDLEEHYCSNICPIGPQRQQLQYEDVGAVQQRLFASLEQLDRSASTITRMLEDEKITKSEWDQCEQMLSLFQMISQTTKSIALWNRIKAGEEKTEEPEKKEEKDAGQGDAVQKDDPKDASKDAQKDTVYKVVREKLGLKQQAVSNQVNIHHERIGDIERGGSPTAHEVIALSRAYLSPRIRNFYCYHECPIGGKQEPLDINDPTKVALMMVSSLIYLRDMNNQIDFIKKCSKDENYDPNSISTVLPELKELANRADTLSLWIQEELCGRLRAILADNKVTADEREEFVRILGFLKQLNVSHDFIEELREYLKE